MISHTVRGYAFAIATACLFTSFVLGSRLALTSTLSPADMTAIRFAVAALLVSPIFLRHRLNGLSLCKAIVLACTGGGGFAIAAYTGFSLAPASHGSALIHGALPLTTLVIHAIWLGSRPGRNQVVAGAVTACGIVFMISDSIASLSAGQLLGDASLLLASGLWSAYGICLARWRVSALRAAAMVAVLSATAYLPIYLITGSQTLRAAPWTDIAIQAVLQGVLVGVLSNLCYAKAVSYLGPSQVAAALAAVPVAVVVGGIFLLHELPGLLAGGGVLLVVLGVVLHTYIAARTTSGRGSLHT